MKFHKDFQGIFIRICNELNLDINTNKTETKRDLDEVEGKHNSKKTCNGNTLQKNIRELHLEVVGDKVTSVRVY